MQRLKILYLTVDYTSGLRVHHPVLRIDCKKKNNIKVVTRECSLNFAINMTLCLQKYVILKKVTGYTHKQINKYKNTNSVESYFSDTLKNFLSVKVHR